MFSVDSLQYLNTIHLHKFFKKIKQYKNIHLFIQESINLKFIDTKKNYSTPRGNISFNHPYDLIAINSNLKIVDSNVTRPYKENNDYRLYTGHFYLHIKKP